MPSCAVPLPSYDRVVPPTDIFTALGDHGDHEDATVLICLADPARQERYASGFKESHKCIICEPNQVLLAMQAKAPTHVITDQMDVLRTVRAVVGFESHTEVIALVLCRADSANAFMNGASSIYVCD